MKKEEMLIYSRKDLIESSSEKNIKKIDLIDFGDIDSQIYNVPMVLFVDNDGKTKILKNRYGNKGLI